MIVEGICEYCDLFGQYTCREFSLFYQGPPFNSFYVTSELNCVNMFQPRKAAPGEVNLLPCEQPRERQEREARERQKMLKRATAS